MCRYDEPGKLKKINYNDIKFLINKKKEFELSYKKLILLWRSLGIEPSFMDENMCPNR